MKRFFAILLFVLAADSIIFAQKTRELDSLINLQESVHDTVLPRLYHDIAQASYSINPVLGMQYAMMSYDAANDQEKPYYVVRSLYALGISERELGKYDDALRDLTRSLDAAQLFRNHELIALAYSGIGNVYMRIDSLDMAERCELTALRMADSISNKDLRARAFMNLGLVELKRQNVDRAIENLTKSYSIMRDSMPVQPGRYTTLRELANAYMKAGNYATAKNLLISCLNTDSLIMGQVQMADFCHTLAHVYYNMGMLDSAAAANEISMKHALSLRDVEQIVSGYDLMDSIYLAKNDLRTAALYCRQLIDISDTVFNATLTERLNQIHYSQDYLENKKTLESSQRDRKERFYFLLLAALVLGIILAGVIGIISAKRKTAALHTELDNKKNAITDRMKYAYQIQKTVLPDVNKFGTSFVDRFVYYQPRNIVSGDFYWRFADSRYEILAVADCTGHGIPGAILTMLGASSLQDIALRGERNAARILEMLRDKVVFMMGQNDTAHVNDGMDMTLMVVDRTAHTLEFAGAYNPLVMVRDGEISVAKVTRSPIGHYPKSKPFVSQTIDMEPGDVYYMFSDGYASQFGGKERRKFTMKRFQKLLLDIHSRPMAEQKEILLAEFKKWKGREEQVDDVTIVGLVY